MRLPTISTALLSSVLLLAGCGQDAKKEPPKDQIQSALRGALPSHLAIQSTETETISTGPSSAKVSFKLGVAPTENLYLQERAVTGSPAFILLKQSQASGVASTLYGALTAERTVDRWTFGQPQFQADVQTLGMPKGSYGSAAFVVGSPEAKAAQAENFLNATKVNEGPVGLLAYRMMLEAAGSAVVQSGPQYERVRRVAERIVKGAGKDGEQFKWAVSLVDSPQGGVSCLPEGKVVVHSGLLQAADTDARLAAVMSHAVAHAMLHHGWKRVLDRKLYVPGERQEILDFSKAEQRQFLVALGAFVPGEAPQPFTGDEEADADALGLMIQARAGYDPREATEAWKRVEQAGGASASSEFARNHPASEARGRSMIEAMAKAVAEFEKVPLRGR